MLPEVALELFVERNGKAATSPVAARHSTVHIRIHTPGGSVTTGVVFATGDPVLVTLVVVNAR